MINGLTAKERWLNGDDDQPASAAAIPAPEGGPALTDERIEAIWAGASDPECAEISIYAFARAVERAALAACPFCGATGLCFSAGSTFRWLAYACEGCGMGNETRVQTSGDGTPDEWLEAAKREAAKEWNRRASLEMAEPVALPEFEDPAVQIAYEILADSETLPPPEEHWEGFASRRIVAALSALLVEEAGQQHTQHLGVSASPPGSSLQSSISDAIPNAVIAREEFIRGYAERSGLERVMFDKHLVALPCCCGEPACVGWAAVHNTAEAVLDHLRIRPEN